MTNKLISLSVPEEVLNELDDVRGDIPRSVYLRKIIINSITTVEGEKKHG